MIVSGGIQKSASSLARLANVLGHNVYANDEAEASLRGAAVYGLEKLGFPIPVLKLSNPVKPQLKLQKQYREERDKQRKLEELLRPGVF